MLLNCNANTSNLIGYVIEIYPTEEQKILIRQTMNIYRAVFNIALNMQNMRYRGFGLKYIDYFDMCKIFSELRKLEGYEWLQKIPLSTAREALRDLNNGFKRFFRNVARYPKFKSKKYCKKSFTVRSDRTYVKGRFIFISGIGDIDAKDHKIPIGVRVYHPTITYDGYNRYYLSLQIEVSDEKYYCQLDTPKTESIGVDVGIRNLATLSDGTTYHFPKSIDKYMKKLKRKQRRLSKDFLKYYEQSIHTKTKYENIPKSKNHFKRLEEQYKITKKIKDIRKNCIHNMTKDIINKNPESIVIETIKVRHLIESEPWMRKYAPQMCFTEIHRQIMYKAKRHKIPVYRAPNDYPSTKTCNNCGYINKRFKTEHIFVCPICGYREDRDLNAAYNLRDLACNQEFISNYAVDA